MDKFETILIIIISISGSLAFICFGIDIIHRNRNWNQPGNSNTILLMRVAVLFTVIVLIAICLISTLN